MNLGLLDLPAPLLNTADYALAWLGLPAMLRIAFYAAASAFVSMHLYRRASNQSRLSELRSQIRALQQRLLAGNDDYAQTRALVRRNLSLSFEQLRLTLVPSLLASLPLLFILPWLANRFDFASTDTLVVCAQPASAASTLRWLPASAAAISADGCWRVAVDSTPVILKDGDVALFALTPDTRSAAVSRWSAFNLLVANPAGYLPAQTQIERVTMAWPDQSILGFGPAWMRGWPAWYFVILIVASLWLRWRWRLR